MHTGDGNFDYTPNSGFGGDTDSFTYTIVDIGEQSASATVEIAVAPQAPTHTLNAVNDGPFATAYETPVEFDVTDNDTLAPDGSQPIYFGSIVSPPANGTASHLTGGDIRYTPGSGFSGSDTFTYSINDGAGQTAQASVTVNVSAPTSPPPPPAPNAIDDEATTQLDTPVTFNVLANDQPSGQVSFLSFASTPPNGTITHIGAGDVEYTPNAGYLGTDTFTYTIENSGGQTDQASVSVLVEEAPAGGANSVAYEYDALGRLTIAVYGGTDWLGYCYDAAGNRTLVETGLGGTPPACTGYTGSGSSGSGSGSSGSGSGSGSSGSGSSSGTEEKTGTGADDIFVDEDGDQAYVGMAGIDTLTLAGVEGDYVFTTSPTLVGSILHQDGEVDTVENIELIGFAGDSSVYNHYRYFGLDTATESADILLGTASANTINGLGGNDIITPKSGNDWVNGGPGQDRVSLEGAEPDYQFDAYADQGVRVTHITSGEVDTLISVEDLWFFGEKVMYPIDNNLIDATLSENAPTEPTSPPINEYPTLNAVLNSTAFETPITFYGWQSWSPDDNGDTDIRYVSHTSPVHGSVEHTGSGVFYYTPDAGYHGTDVFEHTIADGGGHTATGFAYITVAPPVNQPWAWNDPIADQVAQEGQSFSLDLNSLGADPEGLSTTFTATGLPLGLSFSGSTISGTPTETGTFTISVGATDDGSTDPVATSFNITVEAATVNQPWAWSDPIADQVAQEGQSFSLDLNSLGADPEGLSTTFTAAGLPLGLSFSGSTISGTPTETGTFTISVAATDDGSTNPVSTTFDIVVSAASGGGATVAQVLFDDAFAAGTAVGSGYSGVVELSGAGDPVDVGSASLRFAATGDEDAMISTSVTVAPSAKILRFRVYSPTGDSNAGHFWLNGNAIVPLDENNDTNWRLNGLAGQGGLENLSRDTWHLVEVDLEDLGLTFVDAFGIWGEFTDNAYFVDQIEIADQFSSGSVSPPPPPPEDEWSWTSTITDQTIAEGVQFDLDLTGSGSGPAGVAFTPTGLPAGLSISGSSITGTPSATGTFAVSIDATYSGSSITTTTSFNITVEAATVNQPWAWDALIEPPSAQEGVSYSFDLNGEGADPDGDPMTFSASGLPAGLSMTGSTISGTPTESGTFTVTATANDTGGSDTDVSTTFDISVSVASSGGTVAQVLFDDSFAPGTSVASGSSGLVSLSGAGDPVHSGSTSLHFTATGDEDAMIATSATVAPSAKILRFRVRSPGGSTNAGHFWLDGSAIVSLDGNNDGNWRLNGQAGQGGLENLSRDTWHLIEVDLEALGLTFVDAFGIWGEFTDNSYFVDQIEIADQFSSGSVSPPPPPPEDEWSWTSAISDQTITEGVQFDLDLTSSGSGPAGVVFTPAGLPAGLSISGSSISGVPTETGTSAVSIEATYSGSSTSATTSFNITVEAATVNQPWAWNDPIADQVAQEGQSFSLDLNSLGADPEGLSTTFTATGLPLGLSFSGSTISGTPTETGTFTISVGATDDGSTDPVATSFNITVEAATVNQPWAWSDPIADQVAQEGQSFSLDLNSLGADPEGLSTTFTAAGLPLGLSFSGSTISGTPTETGTFTISVAATDDGSTNPVSTTFDIVVSAASGGGATVAQVLFDDAFAAGTAVGSGYSGVVELSGAGDPVDVGSASLRFAATGDEDAMISTSVTVAPSAKILRFRVYSPTGDSNAGHFWLNGNAIVPLDENNDTNWRLNGLAGQGGLENLSRDTWHLVEVDLEDLGLTFVDAFGIWGEFTDNAYFVDQIEIADQFSSGGN